MTTKRTIYDEVVKVLRNELLFDGTIDPGTTIKALGLDSIQLMQLFVYIEEAFQFEFSAESLIESVRDISLDQFADFVHQSLPNAA